MMRVFGHRAAALGFGAAMLALCAAPARAEPVAVPEGFEPLAVIVDTTEAMYTYRRGPGAEEEIVVFRMRNRAIDARLEGQIRDILAVDCSTEARFADLGSSYQSRCAAEYVAHARAFESQHGLCVVVVAIRWPALDLREQALRAWIDALQACAPEAAWTDT